MLIELFPKSQKYRGIVSNLRMHICFGLCLGEANPNVLRKVTFLLASYNTEIVVQIRPAPLTANGRKKEI